MCEVVDNKYDLSITPSRKRKRESGKLEEPVCTTGATPAVGCFTNAAFSSTPKKLLAKRLLPVETLNPFIANPSLEVKSILDIVLEHKEKEKDVPQEPKKSLQTENPYEVVRKPPKKKKKRTEEVCFENPALNLEGPEKQFNPFEVHRSPVRTICTPSKSKCFTNEALNIRGQDVSASRNPFEIARYSAVSKNAANPTGVANMALDTMVKPSTLQIGLPFVPTIGCRIDFKNLPLSQLTPCKLLADKLVFSPMPENSSKTPKRSISSISDESMDIGKELDRYQLELENSINEAKLRKIEEDGALVNDVPEQMQQKVIFTQKLSEIAEQDEEEIGNEQDDRTKNIQVEMADQGKETRLEAAPTRCVRNIGELTAADDSVPLLSALEEIATDEHGESPSKSDVALASDDEDQDDIIDFKEPAPFVRAYRRAEPPILTASKESLHSNKSDTKSDASEVKKPNNVKSIIRNSIRKLIHSHVSEKEKQPETAAREKEGSTPSTIMSSIRHSLRRKPQKHTLIEENLNTNRPAPAEMSIIDTSERTIKLKTNLIQTDYMKIEELTNEKKRSLRSSLRQSTREVRQQFMKTVFHKNQEEYAFSK